MAESIRQSIVRYEPRLQAIQVTEDTQQDDLLQVRFRIEARLMLDDGEETIRIGTALVPSGRVEIIG